jgi:superfamily II DNA or RNA helicase/HKD family nuclease
MSEGGRLEPGLYESPITRRIDDELAVLGDLAEAVGIEPADAHVVLTRHLARHIAAALQAAPDLKAKIELTNSIIGSLEQITEGHQKLATEAITDPGRQLQAILVRTGLEIPRAPARPRTPLSQDSLIANAPLEPNLAAELASEIESADSIDLICAFVVWSGLAELMDGLRSAARRGVPIRILTTTYSGITQAMALERLIAIGARVKVSYDVGTTRLHAKAWRFDRRSGFGTAYVGSSNLSHTALHQGLEWNVRLTESASPALVTRVRQLFDVYWEDPSFQDYEADAFAAAISQPDPVRSAWMLFDIEPRPYQAEILEKLDSERRRYDRHRNLLVAATGTGKTVVSAFDYRRLRAEWGGKARLLFVAHRQEILEQALFTFRNVLRDGAFGELMVGDKTPGVGDHVFASVQKLAHVDLLQVPQTTYDFIVFDEFHHAAAPTYKRLLEHFHPRELLGMTATPERTDLRDVTGYFDGRIAFELRLWDALDQQLLAPFTYFGVADGTDFSAVEWGPNGYDVQTLDNLVTGNELRLGKVVEALRERILDPFRMRCLGFCVSVAHAEWMARRFTELGIPSRAVSGETPQAERVDAVLALRERRINAIFSRDVFNEGIDIPEVDTVMFLRPTESATVFLQQLGRGLRRMVGKPSVTVLDFIGRQHRRFRFAPRLAALTGRHRGSLVKDALADFPYLPPGCSIRLDPVAAEIVLDNLRTAIQGRKSDLVRELMELTAQIGRVDLNTFLRETGRSLGDLYQAGGWTSLRRLAGVERSAEGPHEQQLQRAIGRMRHIRDTERIAFYTRCLESEQPPDLTGLSEREHRLLTMLHFDVGGATTAADGLEPSLARFWSHDALRAELVQLLQVVGEDVPFVSIPLVGFSDVPLHIHERYTRDEILAALGTSSPESPREWREGVRRIEPLRLDLFAVTIEKVATRFSPTTMYRDRPISPTLFQWESQSTTSLESPTGRRYIGHKESGDRIWLFCRETDQSARHETIAFMFLGPVHHVSHRGSKPIEILWRLEHPIPAEFYVRTRAVS